MDPSILLLVASTRKNYFQEQMEFRGRQLLSIRQLYRRTHHSTLFNVLALDL